MARRCRQGTRSATPAGERWSTRGPCGEDARNCKVCGAAGMTERFEREGGSGTTGTSKAVGEIWVSDGNVDGFDSRVG